MWMLAGRIPTFTDLPGAMTPGQLGPIKRLPRSWINGITLRAGSRCLTNGVGCERRTDVECRRIGAGLGNRLLDGVKDRDFAFEFLAALTRCNPGDDISPVLYHLPGMKRTVSSRNSLYDHPGVFVD
jgi:hypothetical protein